MRKLVVFCTVLVLVFGGLTASTWAQPKTDSFNITLDGDNWFVVGGGTGWQDPTNEQQWFYYDQAPNETDWWNQWFYDDPPNDERWKHIDYDMTVNIPPPPVPGEFPAESFVEIAINWSTMGYAPPDGTGIDGPPPMPEDELFIEREVIFSDLILSNPGSGGLSIPVNGSFDILSHNPEWVSIDVRVDSWQEFEEWFWDETLKGYVSMPAMLTLPVTIAGGITHECVPEPSTLALLCVGVFGLLLHIRRRR